MSAPKFLFAALALCAAPASSGAETLVFRDGDDNAPYEFLPALSRGGHTTLYAFFDPSAHGFETFVRFPLPGDLLLPDEAVTEAFLVVYYGIDSTVFGETPDVPATLECRPILEDWDETALTWATKPAYGEVVDAVVGIEELGSILCDVTALVDDWARGRRPNHGIALTNPTPRLLGFYSFEADVTPAFKPALIVTREVVPEPVAGALAAALALAVLACRARGRC